VLSIFNKLGKRRLETFFFLWRAASHRVAAKIPLYHALRILSSEICGKTAQSCIPKLVQNYLLTFLKTFAIIYLQGKEREKQKKKKILKNLLTNQKAYGIIKTR